MCRFHHYKFVFVRPTPHDEQLLFDRGKKGLISLNLGGLLFYGEKRSRNSPIFWKTLKIIFENILYME